MINNDNDIDNNTDNDNNHNNRYINIKPIHI